MALRTVGRLELWRRLGLSVVAAVAMATAGGGAEAQTRADKDLIDNAKGAGIVGEQSNGLLGFRTAVNDPALHAAVTTTNSSRSAHYLSEATSAGTSVARVSERIFQGLVRGRMCASHWWRDESGVWLQAAPFTDMYGVPKIPVPCGAVPGPYPPASY